MNRSEAIVTESHQRAKNSINLLDSLLQSTDLEKGLISGDAYRQGKQSILKTAQLLWAISAVGALVRTNDLRIQLSDFLHTAIADKSMSGQWLRTSNVIYSLLALTAESTDVNDPQFITLVNLLIDYQTGAGWGYMKGDPPSVRTTAMAIYALVKVLQHAGDESSPYSNLPVVIYSAINWLVSAASPQGNWGKITRFSGDCFNESSFEPGIEVTSWSLLAISYTSTVLGKEMISAEGRAKLINGFHWLISYDTEAMATIPEIEPEIYILKGKTYTHQYESTGLELPVIALIAYLRSPLVQPIRYQVQYNRLQDWMKRLLKNERQGYWFDKNCGDYRHLWLISYALVATSEFISFWNENNQARRYVVFHYFLVLREIIKAPFVNKLTITIVVIGIITVLASFIARSMGATFFKDNEYFLLLLGIFLSAAGIVQGFLHRSGEKQK